MRTSEALNNISILKDQMFQRLKGVGVLVDSNNYQKIYDAYLENFGNDAIIEMYDKINRALAEYPVLID